MTDTQVLGPRTINETRFQFVREGNNQNPLNTTPFPGNIIPSSRLDPVAVKALTYLPAPNRVPNDRVLVSESGIRDHADLLRLESAGVKAVLVGESLLRADDIGAQLDRLLGKSPRPV